MCQLTTDGEVVVAEKISDVISSLECSILDDFSNAPQNRKYWGSDAEFHKYKQLRWLNRLVMSFTIGDATCRLRSYVRLKCNAGNLFCQTNK